MKRPAPARILVAAVIAIIGLGVLSAAIGISGGQPPSSKGPASAQASGGIAGMMDVPSLLPGTTGAATSPSIAQPTSTPTGGFAPTSKPTPTAVPTAQAPAVTPRPAPKLSPTRAPTAPPAPDWVTVVDDRFNGGVPGHWSLYDSAYGSGAHNCAAASHVYTSGGILHLLLSYEPTGAGSADCGPGWYSGGLSLSGFSSVDQRVTVRFRVVSKGVNSHFIIPMRWPEDDASWPAGGEEDYCEGSVGNGCSTYLHYSSDNQQISGHHKIDLSTWHIIRTERRNHVIRVYFDNMTNPVWQYDGTTDTLPDTLKNVLLQQECESSCPAGTSGTEDIQIDRVTVANPR